MAKFWFQGSAGKRWIEEHSAAQHWLRRINSDATKSSYAQTLHAFSEWSKKSPEEMIESRRAERKRGEDDNGSLDLVQEFVLSGKYPDGRPGHNGEQVKVGEASAARRKLMYSALRSFYSHHRLDLPPDRSFKIRDKERVATTTFMPLEDARAIIGALKEPYRTLYSASLYSGMGSGELLALNEMWPQIKKQIDDGKDPVRVDFARRKTNEKAYFTFVPLRVFKTYVKEKSLPFGVMTKRGERVKRPVEDYDLRVVWKLAKKRAGIKEAYKPHMLRDLFRTTWYRCGLRPETGEFLLGHNVDQYNYLQINQAPDVAVKEWRKFAEYLDKGVDVQTLTEVHELRGELEARDQKIERLEARVNQLSEILILSEKHRFASPEQAAKSQEARRRRKGKPPLYRVYKDGKVEEVEPS